MMGYRIQAGISVVLLINVVKIVYDAELLAKGES